MKYYITGFLLAFICFGIGYKYRLVVEEREIDKYGIVYPAQNMPMPEEYRMLTGYDSIEYSIFLGKIKVNFCFPNEWEFRDFKNRSDSNILVGTYPDTIMEARVIKPKKKHKKAGYITDAKTTPIKVHWDGDNVWITDSMYTGENNSLNDSLCKYNGHVYGVPWIDLNRTDPHACFRCKKHLDEWIYWEEYDGVIWDTVTSTHDIIYMGDSIFHIPLNTDLNDYRIPTFPIKKDTTKRH